MIQLVSKKNTSPAMLQTTMQGGAGELVANYHALVDALVAVDDKESRSTLGTILKAFLPNEFQVLNHEPAF
jgi:hypothetical protein